MVQVQADRAVADLFRLMAVVPQSLSQLPIEAAVLHVFVEAVHGDQVFRPGRAVHAIPAGGCGCHGIEQFAKAV